MLKTNQSVKRHFINFLFDASNRWYVPVSVYRWRLEEKQEDTSENNNGSSIRQNLSCHVSFCNLDGGFKVLKLLCGVRKEVISKSANDFESCFMIVCTINEDDVFLWRMQEACWRAWTYWIIRWSCYCSFKLPFDRLKFSLSCKRFVELQLLVQCTFNLSERRETNDESFQKSFFLHESQPAEPVT